VSENVLGRSDSRRKRIKVTLTGSGKKTSVIVRDKKVKSTTSNISNRSQGSYSKWTESTATTAARFHASRTAPRSSDAEFGSSSNNLTLCKCLIVSMLVVLNMA